MDWVYQAKVIEIHDGDTITVDLDMGMRVWQKSVHVRFSGINAPELATAAGKASLAALEGQLAIGDTVILTSHSFEKYGRLLCTVTKNGLSLNQWMLDNKYAVVYP